MTDGLDKKPRHIKELQWLANYFESHGRPETAEEIMLLLSKATRSEAGRERAPENSEQSSSPRH